MGVDSIISFAWLWTVSERFVKDAANTSDLTGPKILVTEEIEVPDDSGIVETIKSMAGRFGRKKRFALWWASMPCLLVNKRQLITSFLVDNSFKKNKLPKLEKGGFIPAGWFRTSFRQCRHFPDKVNCDGDSFSGRMNCNDMRPQRMSWIDNWSELNLLLSIHSRHILLYLMYCHLHPIDGKIQKSYHWFY